MTSPKNDAEIIDKCNDAADRITDILCDLQDHAYARALENGFTDSQKRTWHILEREDGSISVYYTKEEHPAHFVVYDSFDGEEPDS